ncbi:trypsin-like peptidase domain-containing protein [Actinomadura sp. HBU206391]|uniref:VMAP-C domain-containing protein n=1 Tax=Actinomadura sp. HBU206391 TaxID=2731692 RepID=UPI00164F4CF2|nr:trypsin-like peptidase domain-containing protein [Actinomadura sp. HBU206391]MBC6458157.1 trypsin-like peptidase domain-containing protein [Actinomadura sp. HBU206391]
MGEWRWRARIETESGRVLGAGFLVDSTHVLTCAHVVVGLDFAHVSFPGVTAGLPAKVVQCTGWAKVGDEGDVAVLELATPVAIAPARFAPLDALRASATELGAYGFPRKKEDPGSVVELRTRPDMDLRQEWWQLNVPAEHLESLEHGFSGAAVYLPDSGEVVGMATDRDATVDGNSGRMLPLRSIRWYWEDIDDLLDLGWLTREQRHQLHEIVRGATSATPLNDVYREAFPGVPEVRRLRSVWDAIRSVAEESVRPDSLKRFLIVLLRHLDDDVAQRLATWMRQHMPTADLTPGTAPTSLIIRLDRMTRGDVYELTLLTLVDGVTGPYAGPIEVREAQIQERVEEALPSVRSAVLGRDWLIEFALPVSLFNEPFETWYVEKENGIRMRAYPVVVRDVQRMNPGSVRRDLTAKRWRRLRERGTALPEPIDCQAQPVDCQEPYSDEGFQDWLDADEECSVLAYAAVPAKGRLNAALNAGIPVMLWPRTKCAEQSHDGCAGDQRLRRLTEAIAHVHPDDVPKTVMKLRKQARTRRAGADHCGRELTLVWDDPARLPDPPLSMGA